jgi:hypothetical protein
MLDLEKYCLYPFFIKDVRLGPNQGQVSGGCIGLLIFVLEIVYNIKKGTTDPTFLPALRSETAC